MSEVEIERYRYALTRIENESTEPEIVEIATYELRNGCNVCRRTTEHAPTCPYFTATPRTGAS